MFTTIFLFFLKILYKKWPLLQNQEKWKQKMVYYEKKPQSGFYAKRIALANGRLYDTKK